MSEKRCDDCANYKSKPGHWIPYDSRPSHQELIAKGAKAALLEAFAAIGATLKSPTGSGCWVISRDRALDILRNLMGEVSERTAK